jgi:HAD superfamily hydrolase (TIGR01493 family)
LIGITRQINPRMPRPMIRYLVAIFLCVAFAAQSSAQPPKVIAFDLFGTVLDLSTVERQEVRDYIAQVRRPEWAPLSLPQSWEAMPAFSDSKEGIERLRQHYIVVTCSNAPQALQAKMLQHNGICVDRIIPLEMVRAYKPDLKTYQLICDVLSVEPSEVLMVTGNEGSPDLDYPKRLGMNTMRIRGTDGPQTIVELAEQLDRERQQWNQPKPEPYRMR